MMFGVAVVFLALNFYAVQKALGLMVSSSPGHASSGKVIKLLCAQLSGERNCWCKAEYAAVLFHGKATNLSKKS